MDPMSYTPTQSCSRPPLDTPKGSQKSRSKALSIIHPDTGRDVMTDSQNENTPTQPSSVCPEVKGPPLSSGRNQSHALPIIHPDTGHEVMTDSQDVCMTTQPPSVSPQPPSQYRPLIMVTDPKTGRDVIKDVLDSKASKAPVNIRAEFAAQVHATLKNVTSTTESVAQNRSGFQPEQEVLSEQGRMVHQQSWQATQKPGFPPQQSGSPHQGTGPIQDRPTEDEARDETIVLQLPERQLRFPVQESSPVQTSVQDPCVGSSTAVPVPTPTSAQSTSAYMHAKQAGDCYCMESRPRGRVLIINIETFKEDLDVEPRVGSAIDVINLRNMFKAQGFTVQGGTVTDTAEKIYDSVVQFVKDKEQRCADCCIIALMSHGAGPEYFYGWDGTVVSVNEIKDILVEASADALREKPKMIVVQACRGKCYDHGLNVIDGTGEGQTKRGQGQNEQPSVFGRVPSSSDFVVAYSTFQDNVSFRNEQYGSWFIQDFCSVFTEYASKEHVLDMLVKVNEKVSQRFDVPTGGVQIPVPSVTLRKKWFLNPTDEHPV